MKKKIVVSSAIKGYPTERYVDLGPGRARPHSLLNGEVVKMATSDGGFPIPRGYTTGSRGKASS
jgi:hypothetical protein